MLSTLSEFGSRLLLAAALLIARDALALAQQPATDAATQAADAQPEEPNAPVAPEKVEVTPEAEDEQIQKRLTEILRATNWFDDPKLSVREGVVFLEGTADDEQHKAWAGELARNTEGVVAVVNRIEITTPDAFDFAPAREEFEVIVRGVVRSLPLLVVAIVVLLLAWAGARMARFALRRALRRRVQSHLLLEVASRASGILVFLLGLYLVLRISGLSRLAVTVIGGTGLVGLVLGIAFRDITENFLASLFLSLQQPFREGDLVEIAGTTGYVRQLTSRTTVLMALDGNQVQIPNATVFKSVIQNFTSSPNRREDFTVGIGYDDRIPHAQEVALVVLADHPAVLKDPEPWVLVDALSTSTVTLRVYFWLDGSRHSWLKVRSSVIRLVKRALQDAGISLPDEAREVIFPAGVPVRMIEGELRDEPRGDGRAAAARRDGMEAEEVSTRAEADLQSDAEKIETQARQAWSPDQGENLLRRG